MLEIIINNNKYTVDKNLSILQACEQANISVPRFCYHEKLSIAGNCRMCLVEIEKSPKPVASCAMPVGPGMVIFTDSPLVKKAREAVLEFLLINHPLDCPICDQGGECDLQDLTLNYGSDRTRFFELKHGVEDKECGPIVKTIMTRCIHCTRCIRFLTEIAGLEVFGALGRGDLMEIGPFFNKYLKTELSGNLVDLCPVGALTSKPYAFLSRNWELKKIETIDFFDAFGSNIIINTRNNTTSKKSLQIKNLFTDQILRVLPKNNSNLNENWISDKTRYAFDGIFFNRAFQLTNVSKFFSNQNLEKKQITFTWSEELISKFFNQLNLKLESKEYLIGSLGKLISVEEFFFFFKFLKNYGTRNFLFNTKLYNFSIDLPYFYQFNSFFKEIENCDFICLLNTNPRFESSMLNLKIRKQFFNKEILIAAIGPYQEFNYPVLHLGPNLKNFLKIVEGKHIFNQKIRTAKKPLIIIGSDIGYRKDSIGIQQILNFFIKKTYLFLSTFKGLNILHTTILENHGVHLGINLNASSFLYSLGFSKQSFKQKKIQMLYNNAEINIPSINIFSTFKSYEFNSFELKSNFIVPINTLYEKDSLIINNEGIVQKSFKSISPLTLSRNSEDFLKILILLKTNYKKITELNNNWLIFENPFLLNLKKYRKQFYFNIFKIKTFQKKINFTFENNQLSLKNFYLNDIISMNSKTMSECTLFLHKNTNFIA
jgi:NADH-quinone oxidoreductase chain G